MKNTQKGFILPLFIIIAILVVGGGTYVYVNKKVAVNFVEQNNASSTDQYSSWKTYKDDKYGFEFKYPNNLSIRTLNVSGPDGSIEHQLYVQGLTGIDIDSSPRLVGVLSPARNKSNGEGGKDFFNLGKAIFHDNSSSCGSNYQIVTRNSYDFSFFSDASCSYNSEITEIYSTFKFISQKEITISSLRLGDFTTTGIWKTTDYNTGVKYTIDYTHAIYYETWGGVTDTNSRLGNFELWLQQNKQTQQTDPSKVQGSYGYPGMAKITGTIDPNTGVLHASVISQHVQ